MRDIVKMAGRLLVICAVAGLCLAITYGFTNPEIQRQKAEAEKNAYVSLFPGIDGFEEVAFDGKANVNVTKIVKINGKDGAVQGYVVNINAKGYKGLIGLSVGFMPNGTISGVRIGSNSETVGLGSKVAEPDYYMQYNEKKAPLSLGSDIVAISGATISSRAVLTGVNDASSVFASLAK